MPTDVVAMCCSCATKQGASTFLFGHEISSSCRQDLLEVVFVGGKNLPTSYYAVRVKAFLGRWEDMDAGRFTLTGHKRVPPFARSLDAAHCGEGSLFSEASGARDAR